jgi:hypothetical protein
VNENKEWGVRNREQGAGSREQGVRSWNGEILYFVLLLISKF